MKYFSPVHLPKHLQKDILDHFELIFQIRGSRYFSVLHSHRLISTRIDSDRLGSTRIRTDSIGPSPLCGGEARSPLHPARARALSTGSDRLGSTRIRSTCIRNGPGPGFPPRRPCRAGPGCRLYSGVQRTGRRAESDGERQKSVSIIHIRRLGDLPRRRRRSTVGAVAPRPGAHSWRRATLG
jgi:hypothetical protein